MKAAGESLTVEELTWEMVFTSREDTVLVRIGEKLHIVKRADRTGMAVVVEIEDVIAEMNDEALDILRRYVNREITAKQLKADAKEIL